MKTNLRKIILSALFVAVLSSYASAQAPRFIVRETLGSEVLGLVCDLLGCKVTASLGDPQGQLFAVSGPLGSTLNFASSLLGALGVVSVEQDLAVTLTQSASQSGVPSGLYDTTPVNYYGSMVWQGYVNQPAAQIINVSGTQSSFNLAGTGAVVAVIDTGVDPSHPMLASVVIPGYDFTRNQAGIPDERNDVSNNGTTAAVLESNGSPVVINGTTAAVLDGTTAAVLEGVQYQAFGHGTIVAGVVHLVAPQAKIMPLKAFQANGTANLSDIIRAVYFAVGHKANVIHMSFSFTSYSHEMHSALQYAGLLGCVSVASAGNNGEKIVVYPAGYTDVVMGVASTSNTDQLSSFSNYGSQVVWVAAPGEWVVSAYPYDTYAAASGTSFSAPMVSGAAALMANLHSVNEGQAASATAHAKFINSNLGHGRLDLFQALQAWAAAFKL